jgi:hypothetical protein
MNTIKVEADRGATVVLDFVHEGVVEYNDLAVLPTPLFASDCDASSFAAHYSQMRTQLLVGGAVVRHDVGSRSYRRKHGMPVNPGNAPEDAQRLRAQRLHFFKVKVMKLQQGYRATGETSKIQHLQVTYVPLPTIMALAARSVSARATTTRPRWLPKWSEASCFTTISCSNSAAVALRIAHTFDPPQCH